MPRQPKKVVLSKLTKAQALDININMNKQGKSDYEIAEHLATMGYVSARTNAPIKHQMVRLMRIEGLREDAKAAKEEATLGTVVVEEAVVDKKILFTQNTDPMDAFKALLESKGVSTDLKMRVALAMANRDKAISIPFIEIARMVKDVERAAYDRATEVAAMTAPKEIK